MRALSAAASGVRHVAGVIAEAGLIVAIVGALAFGVVAFGRAPGGAANVFAAGKGGHNGANATVVTIAVPNGVFAGTVTATTNPGLWVRASCVQSGTVVYQQYVTADSAGQAVLTLGPTPMWSGGSASCKADAGGFSSSGSWKTQVSTTFSVSV
jgi:hypothetical protein